MPWTAADIPSQAGRVAVVTGATSGLGYHTAKGLAGAGAVVVLAVRDTRRGETVRQETGAHAVVHLDLADLASVHAAAEELRTRWPRIDILVNNAGVMALPRHVTADGFELQLATNHLGPFALTGLLLDALRHARVVAVSSTAHRYGRIRFDDLHGDRRYSRWEAYGQTKLANLLFAFELQRRAARAGLELRSVAAHPGLAATDLQLASARMEGNRLKELWSRLYSRGLGQSDAMGALPQLYAATMPDLPGGAFVGPDGFLEQRGHPKLLSARRAAHDEAVARRLWEVSEELTGVRYLS